jgi:hypothetical protein
LIGSIFQTIMPPKKKKKLDQPFSEMKSLYIQELENDPNFYIRAPKEVKDDFDCTFTAISKNPKLFRYASPTLKKNQELLLKLIKNDPTILNLYVIDYSLRDILSLIFTRDLAMECVQRGANFSSLPTKYFEDKELVMESLKHCKDYNIPYHFYSDRDVVLEIVKSDPHMINNVDSIFFMDKEIVLIAIKAEKNSWRSFDFLGKCGNLVNDSDVQQALLESANNEIHIIFWDTEFVKNINLKSFAKVKRFLTKESKIQAITENGYNLFEFSELSNDEEICKIALKSNSISILLMPDRIVKIRSMIYFALENGNEYFFNVMKAILSGTLEVSLHSHYKNDIELLNYCEFCKQMNVSPKKNFITKQFKDLKFLFQ